MNVSHILVVLLEVHELLLDRLYLALDVHAAHVGVVDDLLQPADVCLHRLADGRLILKPRGGTKMHALHKLIYWLYISLPHIAKIHIPFLK